MDTTIALVIAECKRIIEILETPNVILEPYRYESLSSELKSKMHELRRDTLRLEKQIY